MTEKSPLALQAGAGEPLPVTEQVSVTGRLYAFNEVNVTVETPDDPGLTAVGVLAVSVKSGAVAGP